MIGERLGELRKDAGLSQKELADMVSISVHTIGSYEQGKSDPDDETKVKFARIFNVSLDYLLGATDLQIPLTGTEYVALPSGFPAESVARLHEYIDLLMTKYRYDSKK